MLANREKLQITHVPFPCDTLSVLLRAGAKAFQPNLYVRSFEECIAIYGFADAQKVLREWQESERGRVVHVTTAAVPLVTMDVETPRWSKVVKAAAVLGIPVLVVAKMMLLGDN